MSNNERLETLLLKLYHHPVDRFYAHLFFQVDRLQDNKNCPTMGVGIMQGRIKLVYNTDFLDKLSDNCAIEVLKHEAMHLINQHLIAGKGAKEKDAVKAQIENIAMDRSINQVLNQKLIKEIGGVLPESFDKLLTSMGKGFKSQENMPWQYYHDLLQQEREHREEQGEGEGEGQPGEGEGGKSFGDQLKDLGMDEHGMFGEMDALDKAMLEDKIRKAAESAKGDGAGQLPSEVEEMLRMQKKPTISWQREIRQFVGQGSRAEKTNTRSRRNRRYGIIQPGKKRDYVAKILVVLDTSGSMSGGRTEKVLNELYGIYKATPNMELDIVQCDAQIQDVFRYDGKDEFKVSGRGGTEMVPGLKYAEEHKYDGVIFLTDGEFWGEDFKSHNKVSSLWVIAGNEGYKSPIGRTVHIKA